MRNPYDAIGRIGLLLAIAGAVNWLLVGLFEWNLVQWIFTQSGTQTIDSVGERIVYIVVGVGGVLAIPMLAASLARARSRDSEHTAHDSSDRFVETDDTAYYLGAPKNQREETREPRPLVRGRRERAAPCGAQRAAPHRRAGAHHVWRDLRTVCGQQPAKRHRRAPALRHGRGDRRGLRGRPGGAAPGRVTGECQRAPGPRDAAETPRPGAQGCREHPAGAAPHGR